MVKFFTETNPAFNLPVDTIYYIESAHNAELNDFDLWYGYPYEDVEHRNNRPILITNVTQ